MLQPGDHDSVTGRPLYRRFPHHDPSSIDPKRRLPDAMEPTVEIHDVSIDLPLTALSSAGSTPTLESAVTSTATASSESLRVETDNEQSVYSVALLDRCTDLVTRNDSVCDRQRYASSTWFSLVRRRCSNIRGKLNDFDRFPISEPLLCRQIADLFRFGLRFLPIAILRNALAA